MKNPDPEAVRKGRLKLALLGAFFVLPFAASVLVWKFDLVAGSTGNYGTLIPPRPLDIPALAGLKGKWVLLHLDSGACAEACEKKQYLVRQVRRAQGNRMTRVARLWLVTDGVAPKAALLAAIEGTVVAPAGAAAAGFPAERSPTEHVYLVDPLGNLMLRFPRDPDPARVIKDLERLLRASAFG